MTIYRIQFAAVVERCVEVPDDFSWSDAYRFVQESLGWNELAHSAAAVITVDVSRLHEFEKQKPARPF